MRGSFKQTITDDRGDVWTLNQCTEFDNYDCIYSTHFVTQWPTSVELNLQAGSNYSAFLLTYDGIWNFDSGQYGTYEYDNSVFPDCVNEQSCPYSWTPPVDAIPGTLLIAFANSNASGLGIACPGFGFNIEASDGVFAVEDMIAPVRGPYFGALTWRNLDGTDSASHWIMGFASYRRAQ